MTRYKNQQPDVLQTIVIGILKAIWWILTLPFKGIRFGKVRTGLSVDERNYITSKRLEIEKMLNTENQIELKHAVMEADKLADYALKTQGYSGETFADRLRSAQSSLNPNLYNEIWQGHKIRNQIAHETEYRIGNSELKDAVYKLLKYLKAI